MSARVLVVDDLEPNVHLLQAKLTHDYHTVFTASNGREAIASAKANNPDVILLDVMMPEMDGFETCRRLKDDPATRHIPVVMVTALDQRQDRVMGLECGADDFLTKPVDDLQLMARVRSLSRHKMLLDELRRREASGRRLGVIEQTAAVERGLGGRVLIFDDSARAADRLKRILEGEQRPATFQELGALGLGLGGDAPAELLVASLSPARVDALRIVAELRANERTRLLPILAIVDPDDRARGLKALELGVNDLMPKPVDPEELRARARTLLKRKRYADHLRASVDRSLELAVTDQLTGLHNRRYMEAQLKGLMTRAAHGGPPVSVLIVDLDYFKRVNDGHGHDAGDDVLRAFAARLASNFRPTDLVCRFGGEEFVVIMPDTRAREAEVIAQRLRQHVQDAAFRLPTGEDLSMTISGGVAVSEGPGDSPDSILKRADEALYRAKTEGRNRILLDGAIAQNENARLDGRAFDGQAPGTWRR